MDILPWAEALNNTSHLIKVALGAPLLMLDALRFAVGNLPVGLSLVLVALLIWEFRTDSRPSLPGVNRWLAPEYVFLMTIGLFVMMYALMIVKQEHLVSSEHRRFLYCLPSSAVWMLIVAGGMGRVRVRYPNSTLWMNLGMAVLVVGQIFAIQEHRFVLRHGYYKLAAQQASKMKSMLAIGALRASCLSEAEVHLRFRSAMGKPAEEAGSLPTEALDRSPYYLTILAQARGISLEDGNGMDTKTEAK